MPNFIEIAQKPRRRYFSFRFFNIAAAAILEFWNFKFLTLRTVKRVERHQYDKFRQNRSNGGRGMAIFKFFKMAAAAILNIWNFKFLTVWTIKTIKLRHYAKSRQNCSNRGRDITIFRYCQDGGRPPCRIYNACVGTTHEGHLMVFITVQNLVGIDAVVLITCTFFRFREFGLKTPIHAPKLRVFGVFDPLTGEQREKFTKRHILARVRVVWAIMRENPSRCLTCRCVPKKGI